MANLGVLKGEFPKLRKRLDFAEFHPDLEGNSVSVWQNLSAEFQKQVEAHREAYAAYEKERDSLEGAELERRTEEMLADTAEIYAEMWGCKPEEYRQLVTLDEALTAWLLKCTWEIVREYRERRAAKAVSG